MCYPSWEIALFSCENTGIIWKEVREWQQHLSLLLSHSSFPAMVNPHKEVRFILICDVLDTE